MSSLRSVSLFLVGVFATWIALSGIANAITIDTALEEQVLQIIRNHPEVLIESVQKYQKQKREERHQAQQAFLQQIKIDPEAIIGDSPTTASPDQNIVLLEFSDFQCPFCAEAEPTVKEFMAQHGDQVTLVYKHFPLTKIHPQAESAAEAAWAAQQQDKFWEYHNALFEQQTQLEEDLYIVLAESLNLDLERFNRDRHSLAAKAAIKGDIELAEKIGIRGTPFFALNGEVLALPLQVSAMENILSKN